MDQLRQDLNDFLEWNGISQRFLAEYILGMDYKLLSKFLKGKKKSLSAAAIKIVNDFMAGKYFMTLEQMKADPDYIKSKQEKIENE